MSFIVDELWRRDANTTALSGGNPRENQSALAVACTEIYKELKSEQMQEGCEFLNSLQPIFTFGVLPLQKTFLL